MPTGLKLNNAKDQVPWDAECYSHRAPNQKSTSKEESLLLRYPNQCFRVVHRTSEGSDCRNPITIDTSTSNSNAPIAPICPILISDDNQKEKGRAILISKPSIIIDIHGRIICWHLPNILSEAYQVGSIDQC
jgi:hypothetical protein